MKVFREKREHKDVCVQYTDLEFLKKQATYREELPYEVKEKIERMDALQEVASYDTFVSFKSEEAIAYFKGITFIADYDMYKNKTRKEMQRIVQEKYSTFRTSEDEHFINSLYLISRINEKVARLELPKMETDIKEGFGKKIKRFFTAKNKH